jgi:hypothetical protein
MNMEEQQLEWIARALLLIAWVICVAAAYGCSAAQCAIIGKNPEAVCKADKD